MIFTSLASSSAGNAYVIDDKKTKILLECGISYKELSKKLAFKVSDISACFITHEHRDHSRCFEKLLDSVICVYASPGTADALESDRISRIEAHEVATVGTFRIMALPSFHDAAEPFSYLIQSTYDNDKLFFATDTVNCVQIIPGLTHVCVECNYSYDILDGCAHLPDKVKKRIINSHFEINDVIKYLKKLDLSKCKAIYLLHLSDACSNEEEFVDEIKCKLQFSNVLACRKSEVTV